MVDGRSGGFVVRGAWDGFAGWGKGEGAVAVGDAGCVGALRPARKDLTVLMLGFRGRYGCSQSLIRRRDVQSSRATVPVATLGCVLNEIVCVDNNERIPSRSNQG